MTPPPGIIRRRSISANRSRCLRAKTIITTATNYSIPIFPCPDGSDEFASAVTLGTATFPPPSLGAVRFIPSSLEAERVLTSSLAQSMFVSFVDQFN